jgi:hypothetical protein
VKGRENMKMNMKRRGDERDGLGFGLGQKMG